MSDPIKEFFTGRFLNLYGAPKAVDPAAFVAEYTKALKGTDRDILEAASDLIVRKHAYRNWPTVGECCKAVQEVAEQEYARKAWVSPPETADFPKPTPEAKAAVEALVSRTIGHLRSVKLSTRKIP